MFEITQIAPTFRKQLLDKIDPLKQPLPDCPSVVFVWPTEICSIGCAHCSYGSIKIGSESKRMLSDYPREIVQWVSNSGAKRFVACGGGEPLDEPEFLLHAISECARTGLDFEIYTSGVSKSRPQQIETYIKLWTEAWGKAKRPTQKFNVRLSVDTFHEELIGLDPLVEWINMITRTVPQWTVSLRGVRLVGDNSIDNLASKLDGILNKKNDSAGSLILPSGQKIVVQWKGFVFEERGQLKQLENRGLQFTPLDLHLVQPYLSNVQGKKHIGRPLSLHHTVSFSRIDLEVHSNCEVHILQSQAPDLRLSFLNYDWPQMKLHYYRDPLLHRTIEFGLASIAELVIEGQTRGVVSKDSIPFSIEKQLNDTGLQWITAKSLLKNSDKFFYSSDAIQLADNYINKK